MTETVSLLGSISIWVILLPFAIGLARYPKLNNDSKIIFFVVVAGTIPQIMRLFLEGYPILNVFYNLYTPVEFLLYFILFKTKIKLTANKNILSLSLFLFCIISVILYYKYGVQKRFLNEWVIANNSIQISWVCLYLMEYYKSDDSVIEVYQPFFYFLCGITIYATGTTIFYSLWYFVKSDTESPTQIIKIIHHIFNILLYFSFSKGLLSSNYNHKATHTFY